MGGANREENTARLAVNVIRFRVKPLPHGLHRVAGRMRRASIAAVGTVVRGPRPSRSLPTQYRRGRLRDGAWHMVAANLPEGSFETLRSWDFSGLKADCYAAFDEALKL
jgi:hypothetical protein